ncbi:hypothetical protein FHS21_004580 [Phyllobacterium trifolii]|uniref:Uncharacterized protein n=1 Tax=Phyllobacterium trifolii TaxID=300193 RepID=A0A839UC69_9HYPH|nr:hypothetical protein [Phyllobacterium trifolii]MBB3148137.1 hypothetical protein [Phyllobacterium trifolii]
MRRAFDTAQLLAISQKLQARQGKSPRGWYRSEFLKSVSPRRYGATIGYVRIKDVSTFAFDSTYKRKLEEEGDPDVG